MRACGGISKARNSTRPSRPVGPSGAYSLSMQISARWVLPVTSISRLRNRRSTSQGGHWRVRARHLRQRDLELVQAVVARLVDARRLAGRADEQAGEQERQGGVVLPVGDQAGQQVGPAQERAVGGARPADHDVVAAAGAGVAPVQHELLDREPGEPRLLVERLGDLDLLAPGPCAGWMLTSITPGSGVTLIDSMRGSAGGA